MSQEFYELLERDTTEILVSAHGSEQREPIVIASGIGVLVKGTVLGQYNTGANSGSYGVYNNTGSNGLDVARGILSDRVDASSSGVRSSMYRHGTFFKERLTGLDSAAETDLKACIFVQRG